MWQLNNDISQTYEEFAGKISLKEEERLENVDEVKLNRAEPSKLIFRRELNESLTEYEFLKRAVFLVLLFSFFIEFESLLGSSRLRTWWERDWGRLDVVVGRYPFN